MASAQESASLWIRDASLGLELPLLLSAATVLIYMVALQTVICLLWIAIKERNQFKLIAQNILPAVLLDSLRWLDLWAGLLP